MNLNYVSYFCLNLFVDWNIFDFLFYHNFYDCLFYICGNDFLHLYSYDHCYRIYVFLSNFFYRFFHSHVFIFLCLHCYFLKNIYVLVIYDDNVMNYYCYFFYLLTIFLISFSQGLLIYFFLVNSCLEI